MADAKTVQAKDIPVKKKKPVVIKTPRERCTDVIFWIMRTAVVANIVMLFFPAFNPARISGMINRNLSLFSCGVSYDSIVANFGRAFRNKWILEETFKSLRWVSFVIIIAAAVAAVGGCMSLGNKKLKKAGLLFTFAAGIIELFAMFGISGLYNDVVDQVRASGRNDRVQVMYPVINDVFMAIAIGLIVLSVINFLLIPAAKEEKFEMEPKYQLFLMMLPIIALAFVFSYLPLYGWRYAFFEYNSGEVLSMDKFVGFKWFKALFISSGATRRDMITVMKNTLAMSGLGILTSWVPMAFAIFLSEIKNLRFRRIVQTFTTIPNFISWVLVYAIAIAIFNTDGFINTMINSFNDGETAKVTTNYLMSSSHMWLKMLAWGLWKGVGWSAIIYIAAISGIDQGLYEAATVDGAGRFAKMWYITVPELIPTYCVLLLMSIANILSNGMEQYYVFENSNNYYNIQVLDLYVYNLGIDKGLIPLSTVIGMVKSVVSVALLFAANGVSKAVRGESIV